MVLVIGYIVVTPLDKVSSIKGYGGGSKQQQKLDN